MRNRASKFLSLFLVLAMVCSLFGTAMAAEETSPAEGDVVVLYTNDVHTYIDNNVGEGNENGLTYSKVAAYKDSLDNALLVDAGDHIQGTAYGSMDKGATIIELMNAAGYDVATLGNHEFDYDMEGALAAIEAADFPYVSCNFYHEENGVKGDNVLDSYVVFEVNGVKIAFVGITTPESFTKSTPAYFQDDAGNYIYGIAGGEDGSELYEAVQAAIDAAAAEADYVIGLGHLGVDPSSKPWTSEEVIANTTGLDAFIDGHSQTTMEMQEVADAEGNTVVLTQTGEYLNALGQMTISADGTITTQLLTGEDLAGVTPDADVKAIEDAWIAEINTELGQVIGSTADTLDNYDAEGNRLVRKQETNTGDFAADALYYLFDNMGLDVDVAVMNGGGIRNTTTTGEISYLTCKEIHTFGNVACLQTVTGQQILDALEWGAKDVAADGSMENGGFLQVSGLKYTINTAIPSTVQADEKGVWTGAPTGDYRVTDVQVLNSETGTYEPLDLTASYNLAGYNYTLRDLGDGFAMFEGAVNVLDYVMEDYMVLANYVQSFEDGVVTGYAEPQGRITVVNEAAAETPADWADVDAAAWYAEAVNYVIMEGKPAVSETAPEGAALTTAEDGSVTGWTAFSDVAGTWYADAANWAAGVGLAAVPEDRTFNGDRDITRAEIATIFARYAEYKGLATAAGDLSAYADAADVAEWAADGMSVAVGSGILGGKPGDLLDPNGTAIRTELATILLNFSKLTPAEETETGAEATYISETVSIEANGRIVPAVVTLPVGEGPFPAVVLNHGHGGNKDEGTGFGGIAEALAEAGIASIRMDFPGCGDSTEPFTENTLSNMIADSNAAKDYLVANYPVDADKLGILGYSMGGRIALEIITAEDNPYKATLILSGLSTPGDEAIANILPEGMTVEDAIAVAEEKGSYDYTTQYGQNLSLSAQWFTDMLVDPLANIDNYTGPMLVIHGDKDDVVTDATNKLTVSSYSAAEELIVPDADHGYGFYSDQPDVTAMVEGSITDFFAEYLTGAAETEAAA